MSGESLAIFLAVGLIAGWLAGQILLATGSGVAGDLLVGVIGAFVGGWLLPQFGIQLGATVMLVIRLVRGGEGWHRR